MAMITSTADYSFLESNAGRLYGMWNRNWENSNDRQLQVAEDRPIMVSLQDMSTYDSGSGG